MNSQNRRPRRGLLLQTCVAKLGHWSPTWDAAEHRGPQDDSSEDLANHVWLMYVAKKLAQNASQDQRDGQLQGEHRGGGQNGEGEGVLHARRADGDGGTGRQVSRG